MGLTREEHPCWLAMCDRCGEGDADEYGGSFHHGSQAEAEAHLGGVDWAQALDGSWLCESCYEEAVTEQYACPHGAGCCSYHCCLGSAPVPFAAAHTGPRRPALEEVR